MQRDGKYGPILAILIVLQLLSDNADHNVVGYQSARCQYFLRIFAERSALVDLFA